MCIGSHFEDISTKLTCFMTVKNISSGKATMVFVLACHFKLTTNFIKISREKGDRLSAKGVPTLTVCLIQ